jgi:hypothetical protein
MKNATLLLSVLASVMLASCAGVSPTRVIGDTVGAAGGALVGHALSKGNPLITAAGAGAGVLLSETLQAGATPPPRSLTTMGMKKDEAMQRNSSSTNLSIFPSCRKDVELPPSDFRGPPRRLPPRSSSATEQASAPQANVHPNR